MEITPKKLQQMQERVDRLRHLRDRLQVQLEDRKKTIEALQALNLIILSSKTL